MPSQSDNLEMTYPRPWEFRLIGPDLRALHAALAEILRHTPHTVSRTPTRSRTGKYHSLGVTVIVADADHRDTVFGHLKSHPAVVMVI